MPGRSRVEFSSNSRATINGFPPKSPATYFRARMTAMATLPGASRSGGPDHEIRFPPRPPTTPKLNVNDWSTRSDIRSVPPASCAPVPNNRSLTEHASLSTKTAKRATHLPSYPLEGQIRISQSPKPPCAEMFALPSIYCAVRPPSAPYFPGARPLDSWTHFEFDRSPFNPIPTNGARKPNIVRFDHNP